MTLKKFKSICVFCGSSQGSEPQYFHAAQAVGKFFAQHEITLVYGGGAIGLMGALATAVIENRGKVIGIIPSFVKAREIEQHGLTESYTVNTMHERKLKMATLAEAFVLMPGGFGSLEEFFEAVTWTQLGLQKKPVGVLNVAGYYDGLLKFLDNTVGCGFVYHEHRQMIMVESCIEKLVPTLASVQLPHSALKLRQSKELR